MPYSDNDNQRRRIDALERALQQIVDLAEKNPDNLRLQQARVLADEALAAPAQEGR
jgi:DNA-binding MurR/RpiR family transcriptional regulator